MKTERDVEIRGKAWNDIMDERDRQDAKWGVQNHAPAVWMLILGEEVGEAAQELDRPECRHGDAMQSLFVAGNKCRYVCEHSELWIKTMPNDRALANYRTELIHTAAVALSAIESLDRAQSKKAKAKRQRAARRAGRKTDA